MYMISIFFYNSGSCKEKGKIIKVCMPSKFKNLTIPHSHDKFNVKIDLMKSSIVLLK